MNDTVTVEPRAGVIECANGRVKLIPPNRAAWLALRCPDVTSTESPMLFGFDIYGTHFELWHAKNDGVIVDFEPNERMGWGVDLQDTIAQVFGRKYGVVVEPMKEYMRIVDSRMGASFDWRIVGLQQGDVAQPQDQTLRALFTEHGPGVLEIKNVDSLIFRDKWIKRVDDEEFVDYKKKIIEPPGHIDIQVQHQLHVCEYGWGCIGVLVGGNRGEIITRLRDRPVGDALEARIRQFWETVKTGTPPLPIYPGDAEFIAKLYGHAEPGTVFDARGNAEFKQAIVDYSEALTREKLATEDKKVARAKALVMMADAERAIGDGYSVSASVVGPCRVEAYDRKGYRGWRVTLKKG